jgi:hypothetical protein
MGPAMQFGRDGLPCLRSAACDGAASALSSAAAAALLQGMPSEWIVGIANSRLPRRC